MKLLGEMRSERLTLILVNLAGIMERADESLLPGVYNEVGAALHTDPTGLGSLTLFRSIVQSSCYPLAAYLSVRHNRTHVIALGAFLWAAATFLVAISSTFVEVGNNFPSSDWTCIMRLSKIENFILFLFSWFLFWLDSFLFLKAYVLFNLLYAGVHVMELFSRNFG